MTMFSKSSNYDIDLGPTMLKRKLVRDIVILNSCVKINQICQQLKALEE